MSATAMMVSAPAATARAITASASSTMLTYEPWPDVARIHDSQIVLLSPLDCRRWLDPATPADALTRPLPAGTLNVTRG